MTTLVHYQTLKTAEANALSVISAKLDQPNLRMDDFALMVKAMELMENIQDPLAYEALKHKIAQKSVGFYSPDLSGEDLLMLTRATRIGDVPFGGEERWKLMNRDNSNLDLAGDVMVGDLTYDNLGRVVSIQQGPRLVDNITYDDQSRMTGYDEMLTIGGIDYARSLTFTYTPDGQIDAITEV